MEETTKSLLKFLILPLLLLVAVVTLADHMMRPDFLLHVNFYDVGQGDSTFIQTYLGKQIVIDGGPSDKVLSELGVDMPFYDRSIDLLILTHPDADHVSGFVDILKRYKVQAIYMTPVAAPTAVYRQFLDLLEKKGVEKIYAHEGQRLWLDSATVFDVYYPPAGIETAKLATNNTSIQGKLSFGKIQIMFTGDATSMVEDVMLPKYNLDSDILKVAHHGSRTSTSDTYLAEVTPEYAVIAVGAKNTYGHPTKEVLDRLNNAHAQILRTDVGHTIRFTSDGTRLYPPL